MSRLRFSNRVAIVTGGASGIGRATALLLAKEGAKVVVADIDNENGNQVVKDIVENGGVAKFIGCDVSKEDDIEHLVNETITEFKAIHILVNNAACFIYGHVKPGKGTGRKRFDTQITQDDWEKMFQTNVIGCSNAIKHVAKHMKDNEPSNHSGTGSKGSIVNLASVCSIFAMPESLVYNATKGALAQVTRCCALDLSEWKIRVNMVMPGVVDTPIVRSLVRGLDMTKEQGEKYFADNTIMKRFGKAEEIANGVAFLASEESSFMTGASLVIDGGFSVV